MTMHVARSAVVACAGLLLIPSSSRAQAIEQLGAVLARTEFQFTRIGSIRELRTGAVLVADTKDDVLYRVDLKKGSSARLLRKGDGPAEYREIGTLFPLDGDGTFLTDGYRARSFLLDGDSVVSTISETQPTSRALGSLIQGADGLGRMLGWRGTRWRGSAPKNVAVADSLVLLLADRRSGRVDTIARLKGTGSDGWVVKAGRNGPGRIISQNPLASHDVAAMTPDGWTAVLRSSPYRAEWRSPTGQWRSGPVLETLTAPPTTADKCHAIQLMVPTNEPCVPAEFPGWPPNVPPFVTGSTVSSGPVLLVDGLGNLVVARTPRAGERSRVYDVIDRRGIRVRRVSIAENAYLVGFGATTVYVVAEDDTGLQQLVQLRWTR